jgi:hypothetical protein
MKKKYLKEILRPKKIWLSKLPARTPILFIPKLHRYGFKLCVNYRELNKVMILNRYALQLINKLRTYIQEVKLLTKIDFKSGYNLV